MACSVYIESGVIDNRRQIRLFFFVPDINTKSLLKEPVVIKTIIIDLAVEVSIPNPCTVVIDLAVEVSRWQ